MTRIRPFRLNYGDGSDGSPASSSFTVEKQEYQWVNYTLDNGHTITLSSSYKPSIFRCRGTFTLNGTINGDGKGWPGGAGGSNTFGERPGTGPGAGIPGTRHNGVGGHGGRLEFNPIGGLLTQSWDTSCSGSGGGGGGATNASADDGVGTGGAGANGLVIIARRIVLSSTTVITMNGAAGTAAWATNTSHAYGGGGGGSGGPVILIGEIIEMPASGTIITATGGGGGVGAGTGGEAGTAGEDGQVYLVYLKSITPSDAASRCNPAATVIDLKTLPRLLG
jgi:hypothetical protein